MRASSIPPAERSPSARRTFIEESAVLLGRRWALLCRTNLKREGRAAAGAWPGTLNEARSLIGHALRVEMDGRKMPTITEPERELAVRTAYASARAEWRLHAEAEAP